MKIHLVSLAAAAVLLSGCVAYADPSHRGPGYGPYNGDVGGQYRERGRDRDGDGIRNRNDRDRDGDGVRNRDDRRPNNPNRD